MRIKHILVVDDSKSARLVIRKMLQSKGFEVDLAESGEQALEQLRARRPDAVLMDHTMPGMDGLEAVKAIKRNPATASIPIAMYTSKESNDYLVDVVAQGAVGVLLKPATASSLDEILDKLDAEIEQADPLSSGGVETIAVTGQRPAAASSISPDQIRQLVWETVDSMLPFRDPDQIQRLVRETVESAIPSQGNEFVEERLAEFESDLLNNTTAVASEAAEQRLAERGQLLSEQLDRSLDDKITLLRESLAAGVRVSEQIAGQIANRVTQQTVDTLQERMDQNVRTRVEQIVEQMFEQHTRQVADRLAGRINQQLMALKAEIDNRASPQVDADTLAQIKAAVTADAVSQAQQVARQTAESTARSAANRLLTDIAAAHQSINRNMYILALLAALTGVMAAGFVYYLI